MGELTGFGLITDNASGSGTLTLTLLPSGAATFGGSIQDGTRSLEVAMSGSGSETLSGASNYGGGTLITSGALYVGSTDALGAATGVLTVNGGMLDLDGNSLSVGGLESGASDLAGVVTNTIGTATLTIGGISGSDAYYGELRITASIRSASPWIHRRRATARLARPVRDAKHLLRSDNDQCRQRQPYRELLGCSNDALSTIRRLRSGA